MKGMRLLSMGVLSVLLALSTISLNACSDGKMKSDDSFTGLFSLGITDTPLDEVSRAVVQFSGIEIEAISGEKMNFDFETPRQIDLLSLSGGGREFLLDDQTMPAGHYNWIRLKIEAEPDKLDSYIELIDGSIHSLKIPSDNQSCLKLARGFEVPLGGITDFTIDFDLRKSILTPPGSDEDYILRPMLRMVDNVDVGNIAGIVDPVLIDNPDNPVCAVYVFKGLGTIPDDIDGVDAEPVTTAVIRFEADTGRYSYRAAFLNAGNYTLALTYQAGNDNPETDDEIEFGYIAQVSVSAGPTTSYDFQPRKSVSFGTGYAGL